ncbi:NTP transferase domain-containing protein [Agriterribacter sp.]|uniref:NTP transferase domain-containing protein n=1 Tax=Agriterribacter sp. TaxID=2821509 RepID=UPI002B5251F6|nr:NTP transferase domain-containing protein [Agriterribacter sp.]HTN08413.1 NTP transferase domain-containing protein [Agriterribacter sp.]
MNAIILAAGMGNRLQPYTEITPKPLMVVNGTSIIERQIVFLKEVGISDINVVVGYKAEMFQYLENKHEVHLIFNPKYEIYNNIYSLSLCKDVLKNTWIIEGDVFLNKNFLIPAITASTYFSIFKSDISREWILEFSQKQILRQIIIPDQHLTNTTYKAGAYVMSGVSFWVQSSTDIIKNYLNDLVQIIDGEENHSILHFYWDQIIKENLDKLNITVQKLRKNDCYEIDTIRDLDLLLSEV